MENFIKEIKELARKNPKRIVFPEGNDERVIEAVKIIEKEGVAIPILIDKGPEKYENFEKYADEFAKIRKVSLKEARETIMNPYYFATMMVFFGDADGMISGPAAHAKERILPALQIIKTKEKFHKVSGFIFMILPETANEDAANGGILMFADCAVIIEPTAEELADIAIDSAITAKRFGIEPKVAMLSFSTGAGANNPHAEKIQNAIKIVQERQPDFPIADHEMQADTALMDDVAKIKDPMSKIAGKANILIFPDLEAGNIAYKLVERLAGAKAIGPILQGLNKPINEVSRGCTSDDIVNLVAITTIEAGFHNYPVVIR